MPNLPLVAISVLNYNNWKDTIECLESLLRLDYPNFRLIVVDNCSPNDSVKEIRRWAERKDSNSLTFIESAKNLGYAGGNNLAIRHGLDHGARYVWILNNDTIVSKD